MQNNKSSNPVAGFSKDLKSSLRGRYSAKAILAVIVFGMIIAVFIMSDINGRSGGQMGLGAAAKVNGALISVRDFERQYNQTQAYYAQLFGGMELPPEQMRGLKQNVINSLVNREVMFQAAQKEGIYATDSAVKQKILEIPAFSENGIFKTDSYKAILQANQLSPGEFENSIRHDIISQKMKSLFDITYKINSLEKKFQNQLKSAKIKVDYLKLSKQTFDSESVIADTEVDQRLKDEAFKKRVVDGYGVRRSEFEKPEQVKASHILIKADANNPDQVKQAEEKAQKILVRTQKEDFGQLASENSDDPGSKAKKGDLGFFNRGTMVKEFDEAAFTLPIGKVSQLVKTQFGFHIIKVTDKKAASKTSELIAYRKIGRTLIAEEKMAASKKTLEEQISKLNPETDLSQLNAELQKQGLQWTSGEYFDLSSESIPGIGSPDAFKASLELGPKRQFTTKMIQEGDSYYIIKYVEAKYEPVATPEKETPNELMGNQKSTAGMDLWAQNYRDRSSVEVNQQLVQ